MRAAASSLAAAGYRKATAAGVRATILRQLRREPVAGAAAGTESETGAMRLTYQAAENALRLTLDEERGAAGRRLRLPGYVEVGEAGRLVGVELLPGAGTEQVALGAALAPWLADPVAREYVSLEDDSAYIELSAPEEAALREQLRAAPARFEVELDTAGRLLAVSIPRRGAGYEISYPSGNQ